MKHKAAWVLIDHRQDWHLPENLSSKVPQMFTVYATDLNRQVHACELTPSHELHEICHLPFYPAGSLSEAEVEQLDEWLMDVGRGEVSYFHCDLIERLPFIEAEFHKAPNEFRGFVILANDYITKFDPKDHDTDVERNRGLIDALTEYWSSNPLLA